MGIFYIFTALLIILSLQRNLSRVKFTTYFLVIIGIYGYFYFGRNPILTHNQGNLYEHIFDSLAPFVLSIVLALYTKFEIYRSKNTIDELTDKIQFLNTKIKNAIIVNDKVKTERKEIEKRLISEEKESIKIREIIEEISDFDLERIEKNLLNYFQRLIPSGKMVFYKNKGDGFYHTDNNYEENITFDTLNTNLLTILGKSPKDVISQLEHPEIDQKLLIKIKTEKDLFGIVSVNYMDFKSLNRVTIQSLNYFVELLSLQIQNTIIYQRQKELSYSYNSKNIYNLSFLKKMVDLRFSLAKRENITSYLIILKSDDFIIKNEKDEFKIFEDIETLFTGFFRKEDFVFYNQQMHSFIFLLITDDLKVNGVIKKIQNNLNDSYDIELEKIAIDTKNEKKFILEHAGITK